MDANDIAITEFLDETGEMIARITLNLSKIESNESTEETIAELYRDFHSLKGNSYLFGFKQIGQVSHLLESSIDPLRKGVAPLTAEMVDAIYLGLDLIKGLAETIRRDRTEGDASEKLMLVIPKIAAVTSSVFKGEFLLSNEKNTPVQDMEEEKSNLKKLQAESKSNKEIPKSNTQVIPTNSTSTVPNPQKKASIGGAVIAQEKNESSDSKQPETLRVQVGILDKLMNLVGELVLVRNQHLQNENTSKETGDTALSQRLNNVTAELQEEVMKTRMQPIGTILAKYQRVVRDLSRDLGKKILLQMEGNETELDKTLLEAVKDPLMHIVRNSVDHGIELPEDRAAAGKPEEGTVKIRSYHEGGQVVVEIEDDGKGLSRQIISDKIIEKGLSTQDKLSSMSDRDVFMFIFAPGFSTAQKVSNVSGRGVGMDVVRTNIEQIGGIVDLLSSEGRGTTIRLKIPLTLAIIPAIIVRSGGERFAIPQVKLVELVRLERHADGKADGLEELQGRPVYRLRGQLLPLISLNEVLGIRPRSDTLASENIVVLNADSITFGLVVDDIDDSADIVVKPLMQFLKDQTIYSGATVLGDGSVALTIDVIALASHVGILSSHDSETSYKHSSDSEDSLIDNADYLMIDVGAPGLYAIPLCLVNRLEEFKRSDLELSGAQRVVQYREGLLPILSVPDFLNLPSDGTQEPKNSREDKISVVVIQKSGNLYGLEVQDIIEVVNVSSSIDSNLVDRPGILGTMVVGNDVIVLLDVYAVISTFEPARGAIEEVKQKPRPAGKILVVEDNAFFRKQIVRILTDNGFETLTAINGQEGFNKICEMHKDISLVLSDIEMPVMNGFEMAEAIRKNPQLDAVPLIALTTLFRKQDIERGIKIGFVKYLEKLNPEQLINEIEQVYDAHAS